MSRFAFVAQVDPARFNDLVRLRAEHYRYLLAHKEMLVFGGPTRDPATQRPETMIIVLEAPTLAAAESFVAGEPYHKQGCFAAISLREWSQVMPEVTPGALAKTVAELSHETDNTAH